MSDTPPGALTNVSRQQAGCESSEQASDGSRCHATGQSDFRHDELAGRDGIFVGSSSTKSGCLLRGQFLSFLIGRLGR
jgi:hypothetical protein